MPHCPQAMITRALENNVFTITSNRVGVEERTGIPLKFIGKSRIIGPDGEILGQLGEKETGLVTVDINPQLAVDKQITANNNLFDDRRPEFY